MHLNEQELEWFSRQILASGVGGRGQGAWFESAVALVGRPDLLGPCALYLARAGVGHIAVPAALLPQLPRGACPRTSWYSEAFPGGFSPATGVSIHGCEEPGAWHAQVRQWRPQRAAVWVSVQGTRAWVACWPQPFQSACPLDDEFWQLWSEPGGGASHQGAEPVYGWGAATLAASLALRALLEPRAQQEHAWFLQDFGQGLVRQQVRQTSSAPCEHCRGHLV